MKGLLFALLLLQIVPQQNPGTVTGVVRGKDGVPAAGVRVYAVVVGEGINATDPGAMESLALTDVAGRYRLQVAPGRYYIGSGSVLFPTYYPGTEELATARALSVSAGGLVEGIDFSEFVPALPFRPGGIPPLPRGSTGVLQGAIRFPDGTPARGITVAAVPMAALAAGALPKVKSSGPNGPHREIRRVVNGYESVQQITDANGRYRFDHVARETYYVAAGFSDLPVFFPGTSDLSTARTFATTSTTVLDLNLTVPYPPTGVRISGRVIGLDGPPAEGATVQILRRPSDFASFGFPQSYDTSVSVNADGTFEARDVLPGTYSFEAREPLGRPGNLVVNVADEPITGLDLYIPIASLSGRIMLDDGTVFSFPQIAADALVTTVTHPNDIETTILPISKDGTFTRLIEADEYRFYLRNFPDQYSIKSITYGAQDLLKGTLRIVPISTVVIEIRVTRVR